MIHKKIEIEINGNNKYKDFKAELYTYLLDNLAGVDENRKRPAVLILPGGGYTHISDREGEPVAIQMNAMGFHAFVLQYSCTPAVFPTALLQAAKAVSMIREHAQEWHIEEKKIIILGFSAGGHLAASLGTFWKKEFVYEPLQTEPEKIKPDGLILAYPVITSGEFAHQDSFQALLGEEYEEMKEFVSLENQIEEDMMPVFLWHTFEDGSVPAENSLLFADALRKKNIPFELHIYPRGRHGLSLANEETNPINGKSALVLECQNWITMAGAWIKNLC